jgi:TP901 family phage tail tape measure protein
LPLRCDRGQRISQTLLNIQASTGATAQELDRLKAASMQMSQAMGVGPTQIANSFVELLKAGMSVEQVLGGAGKAAIEFATVGQMDVAEAGVVMADAMKVFGVTADVAANAISSAADASSTSIEGLSQAFAQVSAVAALANQSIGSTSAALAILANAGVKGSDAGTSLKTMLLRLMAPADEAVGAAGLYWPVGAELPQRRWIHEAAGGHHRHTQRRPRRTRPGGEGRHLPANLRLRRHSCCCDPDQHGR